VNRNRHRQDKDLDGNGVEKKSVGDMAHPGFSHVIVPEPVSSMSLVARLFLSLIPSNNLK